MTWLLSSAVDAVKVDVEVDGDGAVALADVTVATGELVWWRSLVVMTRRNS